MSRNADLPFGSKAISRLRISRMYCSYTWQTCRAFAKLTKARKAKNMESTLATVEPLSIEGFEAAENTVFHTSENRHI